MGMVFGQKLRRVREAAGLSQAQFAELLGIGDRQRVSMIELGSRPFPVELVGKLPQSIRLSVIEALQAEIDEQIADLRKRRQGVGNGRANLT